MSDKPTCDYSTAELLKICAVDNGWAATELEMRIDRLKSLLSRCESICENLSRERTWAVKYFGNKWHSPLRSDAAIVLNDIRKYTRPSHCHHLT